RPAQRGGYFVFARADLGEMVVGRVAHHVLRLLPSLHRAQCLEEDLSGGGNSLVRIAQVLGRSILDWPGALGRAAILGLEVFTETSEGDGLHLLAVLQV